MTSPLAPQTGAVYQDSSRRCQCAQRRCVMPTDKLSKEFADLLQEIPEDDPEGLSITVNA